jgi:hypothetical protein
MGSIADCLAVWALAAIVLVWSQWRWGTASTGIPVAYFFGLALIHVPGAVLYLDPSYEFYDPDIVQTGLQIATLGVFGFVLGVLLGGTTARPFSGQRSTNGPHTTRLAATGTALELNRLAWFFLGTGFFVQFVVMPLLRSLPIAALLGGLAQLTVTGACLGLYAGYISGNYALLRRWLIVAAMFPVVTVISSAFIGYGVGAMLMVVSFAVALFRPRLWTVIPFGVAIYLGLSIYVTYARDRTEYREAAWQDNATLAERADRLITTFADFEFVDLKNPQHQSLIDLRMNQNSLVGAAEAHIAAGRADFARGETLWLALIAPIPRLIWPGKPEYGGSGYIVTDYTGITFAEGTSVGVGQVMEFFINFGWWGEFLLYVAFGAICRRLDMHAGAALRAREFKQFLIYFLPAVGLLQPGGQLAEMVATASAAFFSALLAATLADRYLTRLRSFGRIPRVDSAA